jgi:hypothetical protein
MFGLLTSVPQLLDAHVLLPKAFPNGTGKLGLSLGDTVPQGSDLMIRHVFHEKGDNVPADHQVTSAGFKLSAPIIRYSLVPFRPADTKARLRKNRVGRAILLFGVCFAIALNPNTNRTTIYVGT